MAEVNVKKKWKHVYPLLPTSFISVNILQEECAVQCMKL